MDGWMEGGRDAFAARNRDTICISACVRMFSKHLRSVARALLHPPPGRQVSSLSVSSCLCVCLSLSSPFSSPRLLSVSSGLCVCLSSRLCVCLSSTLSRPCLAPPPAAWCTWCSSPINLQARFRMPSLSKGSPLLDDLHPFASAAADDRRPWPLLPSCSLLLSLV
jgi:hypothetical protein